MENPIEKILDPYGAYKSRYIKRDFIPVRGAVGNNIYPTMASVFQCCGARQLSGLSGNYLTTEERQQEFVNHFVAAMHGIYTIFFVASTYQLKQAEQNSVISTLINLGAVEVHANPNRVHGPSKMHLHVIDPGSDSYKEGIKRFLFQYECLNKYGYKQKTWLPRFVAKELGIELEPAPEQIAVIIKRKSPLRDAFGRFVSKVNLE